MKRHDRQALICSPAVTVAPEAVFIGGCPRSGTTLLASLLGALPGCVVTPESQFKQSPLRRLQQQPTSPLPGPALQRQLSSHLRFRHWDVPLEPADLVHDLGPLEWRQLLLRLVRRFAERQGPCPPAFTWIDHTPQNIESGLALAELFPDCRLIHLVRDPRAVAASLLPLDWGPHSSAGVAALWSHRLAYGLALEAALPDRIRRVRYEDLCRDPQRTLAELADWLGLESPAAEQSLQPVHDFLPAYTVHQHALIGSPPRTDRIEAWRHQLSPWQQRQLESRLGELMTLAGYPPDAPPPAAGERPPGLWRLQLLPLLRSLRGRIRHRRRQRLHGGQLR